MMHNVWAQVVCVLLVCGLLFLVSWWVLKWRSGKMVSLPAPSVSNSSSDESERIALNPLSGISFDESLDSQALSDNIQKNLASSMLTSYGTASTNVVIQMVAATRGRGLIVKFNDTGYELMRTHFGGYKAVTLAQNGHTHEIGNVDTFCTWLNNAAHATAAVVAISHLISNADISRRLGQVQQNTDKLLANHQNETYAELRTAYESLREEIAEVQLNRNEIKRLREIFRQKRHVSVQEAKNALEGMKPLVITKQKGLREIEQFARTGQFKGRKQELSNVMSRLRKASYCLQMESLASIYSDSQDGQRVLCEEAVKEWSDLAKQIGRIEDEIKDYDKSSNQLLLITEAWTGKKTHPTPIAEGGIR